MFDPASLPRPDAACRIGVVVPAKNEARLIERALAAFAAQRDARGAALDPRTFELLVLCNGCTDDTAAVARRFARSRAEQAIHVVETAFAPGVAHVGSARRAGLDFLAARYRASGRRDAVLASTDADSVVDARWVTAMLDEIARVDAVAGHVRVLDADRDRMLAPVRLLYDRECEYRRLLGVVEAHFDPLPHDRGPRHDVFVGASFAVTSRAYEAAGGMPPLPRLEDLAFAHALERIDARVRHSYAVRAFTSARRTARVEGGFGTFLAALASSSGPRATFFVRSGRAAIEAARVRALLRAAWPARHECGDARFDEAARLAGVEARELRRAASPAATFGAFRLDAEPRMRQAAYPDEPVEVAIAAMRHALAETNAPVPTRARTASGAG